jgi:phage terminase small subunit
VSSKRSNDNGLTVKQQRFIREYAKDHNGTQAAIRAGYPKAGAGVAANRMLKNPKILALVNKKTGEVLSTLDVSVERILRERARLAFYDPRKFFDSEGNLLPITDLDDDTAMSLCGMDISEVKLGDDSKIITRKIKMVDKDKALTALEKHLGMYKSDDAGALAFNIYIDLR